MRGLDVEEDVMEHLTDDLYLLNIKFNVDCIIAKESVELDLEVCVKNKSSHKVTITTFLDMMLLTHCVKIVQICRHYWSAFSLAQSKYRKIRTRNNSVFGHSWRSCSKEESNEEEVSDDVTKPSFNHEIYAVFLFQNYNLFSKFGANLMKVLIAINCVTDIDFQGTKRKSIVTVLKTFFNER